VITVQVDGAPDLVLPPVDVVPNRATRRDIVMSVPAAASSDRPALAAVAQPSPPAPAAEGSSAGRVPAAAASAPSLMDRLRAFTSPLGSVGATLKPAAAASQAIPEALTSPDATEGVDNFTPFAFGDFTWLNGSPRNKAPVFDTKFFTPDIRMDAHYMDDLNHPKDHTIVGSTESFRSNEFQVEQISFGGDFHWTTCAPES